MPDRRSRGFLRPGPRRPRRGRASPTSSIPHLVRGLDYYRHTAFEFVTDRLGAQGTVIAGGRYDGLIESLGGPHTPAIGWAAGIERLAMMIDAPDSRTARRRRSSSMDDARRGRRHRLLRRASRGRALPSSMVATGQSCRSACDRAVQAGARFAVIIGDGELDRQGRATSRILRTRRAASGALDSLAEALLAQ